MSNVISANQSNFKHYKHNGFSSTISDSYGIANNRPTGVSWDGTNELSVDSNNNKHYKHSGFSSTITSSHNAPSGQPEGISWDGANALSAGEGVSIKHYKHSGFSSTVTDSYTAPASNPRGITWDGANVLSADYSTYKHYKHSGFSSTITSSYSAPVHPYGITWDDANVMSVSYTNAKHYKHDGFSNTITSSYSSPSIDPTGITWDARYTVLQKSSSDTGSGMDQATVGYLIIDGCASSESSSIQSLYNVSDTVGSSDEVLLNVQYQTLDTGNGITTIQLTTNFGVTDIGQAIGIGSLTYECTVIADSGQGNDISGASEAVFKGISDTGSFEGIFRVVIKKYHKWWETKQKILIGDLNRFERGTISTNILTPGQSSPPDMKVHVSEGYVYFNESAYYFTAADSSVFVSPIVNPRWDGLYLDNSGTLKIVQGNEAESPQKPQFKTGCIPIAYVYHRIGESKLIDHYDDDNTNGTILGIRKFLDAADMRKSVYDSDKNSIVEDSSTLGGISAINHLLTDGSRKLTGHLDFNGHRMIGLINPTLEQEVATKTYIDTKPFELERSDKVAGETIVFGNIVYLKSDNKWHKASALNYGTAEGLLAMVLSESVGIDESVSVMLLGEKTNILWSFTKGAVLYLGTTLGEITETEPSESGQIKRKIGFAYDTDTIYFNPDLTVQEVP